MTPGFYQPSGGSTARRHKRKGCDGVFRRDSSDFPLWTHAAVRAE